MTGVLFAVIALSLVTAVVVLLLRAPGGSPVAPTERPLVAELLPTPFGADELQSVRLPLAVRGYRMADVDALLARIAAEWQPRMAPPSLPQPQGSPVVPPDAPYWEGPQ